MCREKRRNYDENGNPTCRKCDGDVKSQRDESASCDSSVCQSCGHEEVHGFGQL
jgi:hypothetical protein